MSERHAAYIVVLDEDYRAEDDAQPIISAIRMVKGVLSVKPVTAHFDQAIARERRDYAWQEALLDLARKGPEASEYGNA